MEGIIKSISEDRKLNSLKKYSLVCGVQNKLLLYVFNYKNRFKGN